VAEERMARVCVRYGGDKIAAVVAQRTSRRLHRAFARWATATAAAAASETAHRALAQARVAQDRARAERGVFERAEMQRARERQAVMLWYAFARWRDMTRTQRAVASVHAHASHAAVRATLQAQAVAEAVSVSATVAAAVAESAAAGEAWAAGVVSVLQASVAAAPA